MPSNQNKQTNKRVVSNFIFDPFSLRWTQKPIISWGRGAVGQK